MKDAFFRWYGNFSEFVYKAIVWVTYAVKTWERCRKLPRLSANEKRKIAEYWKKNYGKKIPLYEYRWYKAKRGIVEPEIIPDLIWHSVIEPYFTNLEMEKGFQDKNYLEAVIRKTHSPRTLLRCVNGMLLDANYDPVDLNAAFCILKNEKETICKPSIDSGGGRGIRFLAGDDINEANIQELVKEYKGNFVIQQILKQHSFLGGFNSMSLNTIRMLSFLFNGKVFILSAFLRIGGEDSRTDNVSSGGYYVQILKDGSLEKNVVKEDLNTHDLIKLQDLPNGKNFEGLVVPEWEHVKDVIQQAHYKLAHFQLINWDVAIEEDGTPVVIEYNLIDASAYFHQLNIGPIFGELTGEVLEEVRKNKRKN